MGRPVGARLGRNASFRIAFVRPVAAEVVRQRLPRLLGLAGGNVRLEHVEDRRDRILRVNGADRCEALGYAGNEIGGLGEGVVGLNRGTVLLVVGAADDERQLRRQVRRVIRRQPVPQGPKHDAKHVPGKLPVRTDLLGDVVEPDVCGLEGFVENVQSGRTHLRLHHGISGVTGGTLRGSEWFPPIGDEPAAEPSMPDAILRTLRGETHRGAQPAISRAVRASAEDLPAVEHAEAFGQMFDRFGDARVVLLGEATHGTSEFYRARAAITRQLITRHGFNIVAVEADWPDAARVDAYVRHHAPRPLREEAFTRFPTWMWRNEEVRSFIEWLRAHNESLPPERRASFRGLDVYSLGASIEAVLDYLDRTDPARAKEARRRYACLTPWHADPASYGRAVMLGVEDDCEDQAIAQLKDLLGARLDELAEDGEAHFDATQNARIVRAAEQYYRVMYRGSRESWNLRDRHMFETLQSLLGHAGGDAKAVVWAHNSHIGNAGATSMGWQGEFNIGELCRTAYGDDAVLIGFGTDRGTVIAASDWGGAMSVKTVLPARPDSYEFAFRHTGRSRSLTDWRGARHRDLADALRAPMLERAIGVIYRPDTELASHYFEAVLAEQFDAYVWFEETNALTPLQAARPQSVPETYPFGV
jgi:erythromycin esterase-like protein